MKAERKTGGLSYVIHFYPTLPKHISPAAVQMICDLWCERNGLNIMVLTQVEAEGPDPFLLDSLVSSSVCIPGIRKSLL
jgi:hypothetical protein